MRKVKSVRKQAFKKQIARRSRCNLDYIQKQYAISHGQSVLGQSEYGTT